MALTKYKLGELIELVLDTNIDLKYGSNDVRGMTITKEIIPTKADVSGTDLSRFIIVSPNEFIYNPRTHGKRIGFGYNNTQKSFIISWNNIAFKIQLEMKKIVLPDYLFLHFKRDEWDREACYQSWGSSTEVFSWETLCDMEIELPSIDIQQKYVDIYNAMLENQKCYERGLDDLKLVCDANIDKLKRDCNKESLGSLIKEVDERNNEKLRDFYGININKEFMTTVADTNNIDESKYKVVRKNRFVFSGMQTGRDKCIRISLYSKEKPIIVSPAYTTFEIKDTNLLLAEFFFILFLSKEKDRLGWFLSDGSIRSNLDWDVFCGIKIPIPHIDIQQDIVNIYNAYNERKEINEKLKAQIKDICPILIKGSIEEARRSA